MSDFKVTELSDEVDFANLPYWMSSSSGPAPQV